MAQSNTEALKQFFLDTIEGLRQDAQEKGQKFPIDKLRFEADEVSGIMYAPHYVQYLLQNTGRGPGKQPPPDAMTQFVEDNPDMLERAKQVFKYITSQQLGFLIGRKIGREGTDIYSGKKPGIDLLGVMEKSIPEALRTIMENEALKVATQLSTALKKINVPADAK